MRKLLISFVLLMMIAGCVKTPPKDVEVPPVVEQPIEQDEPKQTMLVTKLDESKDWVYAEISETADLYTEEGKEFWRQALEEMVSTTGDDFHDWYNTVYTPNPELTLFKINIDSEDADEVNHEIEAIYTEKLTAIGHQYLSYRSFTNAETLSVVVKFGSFIPGSDCFYDQVSYNFDLTDGSLISNHELLNKYALDISGLVDQVKAYYHSQGVMVSCSKAETEDEHNYCFAETDLITNERFDHYVIFVEDESLYFMGYVHNPNYHYNNVKIKIA